jgi:hypothetical protein
VKISNIKEIRFLQEIGFLLIQNFPKFNYDLILFLFLFLFSSHDDLIGQIRQKSLTLLGVTSI